MKWLLIIVLMMGLLSLGTVLFNRPPLFDPPGPVARLKLYLTTHVAETRIDHPQPELRPLQLDLSEPEASALVKYAMARLGWTKIVNNGGAIQAVVTTRWFGFKDDISVELESTGAGILVQVRSVSRVGRGDFAANTRHILDLYEALRFLDQQEKQV